MSLSLPRLGDTLLYDKISFVHKCKMNSPQCSVKKKKKKKNPTQFFENK